MQFIDCPNCGKRVRDTAARCHHCQALISEETSLSDSEHHAEGGYVADDFDYDEWEEQQSSASGRRMHPVWYYTGWILIVAFLLPVVMQILAIIQGP